MNASQVPDMGKHLVGVHCGVPAMSLVPNMFPPNNRIAGLLLRRVLWLALLRAELAGEGDPGCYGELNDCALGFYVRDEAAAAQVIKSELEQVGLLAFCQIAVPGPGGNWCCVYPSLDISMTWLMDTERQQHFLNQFLQQVQSYMGQQHGGQE